VSSQNTLVAVQAHRRKGRFPTISFGNHRPDGRKPGHAL